ncbi:CehA/McbA family metallohydrolase [Massilia sp. TS11]|uniref:CehA/McbA family metallohydrolase n=1 Tax=Massilia sp. TS11 TaxID=2908003 RepID=UPI001EDC2C44|nr:CehA/McbA family metallohydrolase [Massilia sp. TS11]MCG2584817.1 CehA/McbA family metallohydrolase [Massilia sp. TS11]
MGRYICWLLLLALAGPLRADEHHEFEARLFVPFVANGARRLQLDFVRPGWRGQARLQWRVDLLDARGRVRWHWRAARQWDGRALSLPLWLGAHAPLRAGAYRARLRARFGGQMEEQTWPLHVGPLPAPPLALAAAADVDWAPWSAFYANLHSQSRDSDGGGALPDCDHAQPPQGGAFGPDDAFAYAQAHGLDALMVSEHNHLFDGSTGSNPDADPAAAIARFQAGLRTADAFSAAHPGFVALYGLEWGVIDGGGHLNLFNVDRLLGWEHTGDGRLIGEVETPRSDYAALYRQMRASGWIGQFNHPARHGQFVIDGVDLAYSTDGDAVMVLCEVVNSMAFSNREDEGETRRGNYEAACQALLEAGYHLAFSSDQDNHCANWGMSDRNRTGIVLAAGTTLTRASLLEALRARRVFATMDREARVLLNANGHTMGAHFINAGPLALRVAYAHSGARTVAGLTLVEGVPGVAGSTRERPLADASPWTPAPGEHFYYVRVTQDDGRMLWSAPVWVTQIQQP